jgi:hypothetical protein
MHSRLVAVETSALWHVSRDLLDLRKAPVWVERIFGVALFGSTEPATRALLVARPIERLRSS